MRVPDELLMRYDVESAVSTDEWSASYRVRDVQTGNRALLTVLSPEASGDSTVKSAFWRAVKLWRPLRSPHLLRVDGAGVADGALWIATDDPGQQPLAQLAADPMPGNAAQTVRLIADVAEALDLIHEHGLLHLDLRPASIWVTSAGTGWHARLGGLAVNPMAAAVSRLTTTGRAPVSLAYVAPEQLRGEAVGPATDQYSLACIYVELVTGEPPYGSGHPLTLIRAHLDARPPSLADVMPVEVDAVIARALAKAPEARYPSCSAFVAALSAALPGAVAFAGPRDAVAGPALAVIGAPAAGMRFALTTGSHVVGRGGRSDFVVPDPFLSREHLQVAADGSIVSVIDMGSSNGTSVGGETLTAARVLPADEMIEAGASLLCIRNPTIDGHTPTVAIPGQADADELLQLRPIERERLRRPAATRATLDARVGFLPAASTARRRSEPIVIDLAASPVALRGSVAACAAAARWLLVQAAAIHAPDRLVLAAALAPVPGDVWAWVGTIPHAHAEADVLAGSRVATDSITGAALLRRGRALVVDRRRRTRDIVDGVPGAFVPRVLVFVDSAIASGDDVDALATGRDVQVHVVWLGRPDQTPPLTIETVVDIDHTTGDVTVRRPATDKPTVAGTADGLTTDLARRAARDLSRDR